MSNRHIEVYHPHYDNREYLRVKSWDDFFFDFFGLKKEFFRENYKCVYLLDEIYVGQTTSFRSRIKSHISMSINNRHANEALRNHIISKLYNGESMRLDVLSEEIDDERFFYDKLISDGFNLVNHPCAYLRTPKKEI